MVSRKQASIKNASTAFTTQLIKMIGQFVVQTIFVRTLGAQYLGANGLFNNLITFLSFAELGIGSAFSYALYKPLAVSDKKTIASIMNLYKKVYNAIGVIILVAGLGLSYFVPSLTNADSNLPNIRIYFILYLLSTVVSYFFTYNRSLLIANQEGYADSQNQLIFSLFRYAVQIACLVFFNSYYGYLIVQILSNFLSNVAITYLTHKRYPFLKETAKTEVDHQILQDIKKNVVGTVSSKIGSVVVTGTDNILISKFIGLTVVGLYSNYSLVLTGFSSIMNQAFTAVIASFGNLGATEGDNREKQVDLFDQFVFYNAFSTFFIALTLYAVFPAFINIWLGPKYQLSELTLLFIIVNFVLAQFRPALYLVGAYGLFWGYRIKSLVEALVNFSLSFILVRYTSMGIDGVLLGTIVGNILVNSWWDPLILFSGAYKTSMKRFYFKYWIYLAIFALLLAVEKFAFSALNFPVSNVFLLLVFGILVAVINLIILLVLFCKTSGEKNMFIMLKRIARKFLQHTK